MIPTNEQIIAEAKRRSIDSVMTFHSHIIEVTREGWTPPEPVDPDVLAFREWVNLNGIAGHERTFLAGAQIAREQERERADTHIPAIAAELAVRFGNLLHSLPLSVRIELGVKWRLDDAFVRGVEIILAKYRGEA